MASKEDNPVGFLQELCQKHGYAFPQFEEVDDSGPDHEKMFTVKCKFQNVEALGKARTKKAAKSEAAKNMILVSLDKCSVETRKEDSNADSSEKTSPVGNKNPVSMLNEFSQKKGLRPPKFEVVSSVSGFVSTCSLEGNTTYGHGDNKKTAKTESANKMCILLKLRHEKDTLSIDKDDANLVVEVENQLNLAEYEEPHRQVSTRPALYGTPIPNGVKAVNQKLNTAPMQEFLQVHEEEGKDEGNVSNDQSIDIQLGELSLAHENESQESCEEKETYQGETRKPKTSEYLEKWNLGNKAS
ncbi:interferon-inducible double-stranded RNA-dependent protein kinase activator A homolog [Macrosteles quadrilineatus]|uniref:interferon-inducible double-stranded RNA-dependent protein kinase activator A homolog n=1 Tax=Macrosteles quadrilineatus TaxID=74068 RepID=UPI0023E0D78B|nr:interferon-inducible double-stranded RNA-dependent protein kinase activator A homolog [Macrosteles quadrilineatus]XP_054258801.1 interferon-inducible double-stranded RNA-dependent protein kinase activator A homolog [Macrosteles quadrilineatus]